VALLTTLATLVALSGCSGGDEDSDDSGGASGERASAVETDARLGKVRGRLGKARSRQVLTAATAIVERWSDQGYGGDYPRKDFGPAFGEFTKDARSLAVKQAAVLSNAGLGGRLEDVEIVSRVVRVDVAAPKGRPAGATARFRLKITMSGGVERTDLVTGRLLLTPTKDGWRVFGFDVRRGEGAK
jgi:hypothetical protein